MEGGIKFSMRRRELGEKFIVRPVTDDGLVGYDEFGQFAVTKVMPDGAESSHHIADVRDMTCVMCGRGWEPTGPSMADQCSWQISSSLVHFSCLVRYEALRQRELFWSSLVGLVRFDSLKAVGNRYWPVSDPYAQQPWYTVELVEHPAMFVFGSRNRVYHVEVVPQGGTRLDWHQKAAEAFEGERVTKEINSASVMLHAWSDEKLREYVRKICEVAGYTFDVEAAVRVKP